MSEFGPSPAEEAEKEAAGVSLASEIAELRSHARTDEDFQVVLGKIKELKGLFGTESTESKVSVEEAKEIMGADFLGPEAIGKSSFGPEAVPTELPPILFSPEELEKAKELGQFLILRSDQIPGDKLELPNTKATLGKVPAKRWALVTKEFIPDSTSKNYLDQTEQLVKYLREEVFADKEIPPEYQEAIAEFEAQKEELRPLVISADAAVWEPAAERLASLRITSLARRSRDEALYDLEVYKQANDQYLLPTKYEWTSSRASDGRLVSVGDFESGGVDVYGSGPGSVDPILGVSFSRSQ
ncbi:MAG: hypothetical protein NTZ65_04655 [Candidatus Berkelbacteria bacterium]|nr:hypothetical protein [Candidatus Berkelbacteria bacterium]